MRKLSANQLAGLIALWVLVTDSGAAWVSLAAWRKACPKGTSVTLPPLVRAGLVETLQVVVSRNGKLIELYRPTPFVEPPEVEEIPLDSQVDGDG